MSSTPVGGGLLGQLAVSRGLLSPDQLRAALEVHARDPRVRLGDVLVQQGLLNAAQVQALLAEQAQIQARLREDGPVAAPAGSGPDLDDAANALSVARMGLAKKTPAQVEAEIAAQRRAMEEKRAVLEARQAKRRQNNSASLSDPAGEGGKIELDLPDDEGVFEIETRDGTKTVAHAPAKRGEAAAPPAAAPPAAAPARAGGGAGDPGVNAADPGVSATPSSAPTATGAGNGRKLLADLVLAAARALASDLHLHPGFPLMIRQHGKMVQSPTAPLAAESLDPALREILDDAERATLSSRGQVSTTFVVPNVARCRVQIAKTAAGSSAVFRLMPLVVPSLSALGLPTALARFVAGGGGLVVLAGPGASGKTWTLAALVDIVNSERREHVVCVERPIEFVHLSKRCVVSQREVPTHARDVARAVRAALHEDLDVLAIGELEDAETVRLAASAAEGGRLVLATVAAPSASRAIARMLGMFPGDQQGPVAAMLASSLRAVVAQRLVATADGTRRMPVCEILEVDAGASEKVAAGRTQDLVPTITFDQALSAALRAGHISRDEARRQADHPEPFL